MSARSVCSGTRPSRYHSMRAISAPPRRPRAVDADALRAEPHRRLHGALHGAAEGDAALELLGDRLSATSLRVDLRLADFDDVEVHFGVGDLAEIASCSFSMSAPFLPITTPGRAEWMVTRHFLCGRSMTMRRHRRLLELLEQVLADLDVFVQELAVLPSCRRTSANPRCG